jgi:hypothetical protein
MAIPEGSNISASSPRLKPPGAGLPWWELLVARHLVFPRLCRKLTWAAAARQFQDEGSRVLAVFDSLPADRLHERILVRRFAGMEDSSRFWSAAMCVEHLNMVGSAIRQTISILRRGEVPNVTPRVADFKPLGKITPAEARSEFVRMLTEAAAEEQAEPPILPGEGPRYAHPWFGPLDAHQWHCLLAFHQGIHRKQIEAIRAGLGAS